MWLLTAIGRKLGKVRAVLSEGAPFTNRIGFMQGTLLEPIGQRVETCLWDRWRDEFPTAQQYGFGMMEWTLGQDRILMNPLMSASGRKEIRYLCSEFGISIPSLTADFIMQAPFYRVSGRERLARLDVLGAVIEACADIGIGLLVVPLVGSGQLGTPKQIESLRSGFVQIAPVLDATGITLALKSDFAPTPLASLIGRFPADRFGIAYDTGSSALLGFDSRQEIAAYGNRIANVYVNDWGGGAGVPLSTGNADFARTLGHLRRARYQGNLILQTAHAVTCHAGLLAQYRAITATWWNLVVSDARESRV